MAGRLNLNIFWQGKSGLSIYGIQKMIRILLKYETPPTYLVLHVGGNDIGQEKVGFLRNRCKIIIRSIQRKLPNTIIVWSQILPRSTYRRTDNVKAMERSRHRINSSVAKLVLDMGGKYIRHPDLFKNRADLYGNDGVHPTKLGYELFIKDLQGGIEQFIARPYGPSVFPSSDY